MFVSVTRTRGTQSASTGIAEELPNVGLNIWGKEVALYGRNAFGGLSWDYVYAQNSTVWLSSSRCHLRPGAGGVSLMRITEVSQDAQT